MAVFSPTMAREINVPTLVGGYENSQNSRHTCSSYPVLSDKPNWTVNAYQNTDFARR